MKKTTDRRRKGALGGFRQRLAVNTNGLDPNYEYRWVNDDKMRLHALTQQDDWDLVADPSKSVKQDGTDLGSAVSTVVGKDESGQPVRAYLARKLKSFVEEDKAEKREALNRTMNRITGAEERAKVPHSYGEGIRIQEGSKS